MTGRKEEGGDDHGRGRQDMKTWWREAEGDDLRNEKQETMT